MHRTPAQWHDMVPSAVMAGSEAQRINVLSMARDDLVELGRKLEAIKEAAENDDVFACHEMARRALIEADICQPIRK